MLESWERRKTDRHRTRTTKKTGITCPAHIVAVVLPNNTLEVRHFTLHIGHGDEKVKELKYQQLPQSAKQQIKAKLQLGVAPNRILSGNLEFNSFTSSTEDCI